MTRHQRSLPPDQSNAMFAQLLSACGIQDHFVDFSGDTRVISQQDLLAVLSAQQREVSNTNGEVDAGLVLKQLEQLQQQRNSKPLPPVVVFSKQGEHDAYVIGVTISEPFERGMISAAITLEDGTLATQMTVAIESLAKKASTDSDSTLFSTRQLSLPLANLPTGYHQLSISISTAQQQNSPTTAQLIKQSIPLILAPARIHEPLWSQRGEKLWGVSVQLYSFCRQRSWGIGDFADLDHLIRLLADFGASYLILNPMHVGALNHPQHCSPYSPVDRRYLNPLYIAPELQPEFHSGAAADWFNNNKQASALKSSVNASEWIDYVGVARLKISVLAMMYEDFMASADAARQREFECFRNLAHPGLADYARWQAEQGCSAAGKFSACADFYMYLQWVAEMQLSACQQQALACGMRVGLVRDLAVGSDRQGAEVQLSKQVFVTAASIGAPPDPLAPDGQNWGLPPLSPTALRDQAYAPFIDLLRSNMAHCGALRIDHVMSLMRLWWCPYENSGQGAYVLYPADDLFAILRLESQRQQCVIIGEDLGIVPDEVRRHLHESGIYSNLLFYFEKHSADSYRSPQEYAPRALAMLANHDVPTLAAWWNGSDLTLRYSLNLIADQQQYALQQENRQRDKKQVLQLLESQWLLPENRFADDQLQKEMDTALAAALMRCIARCHARLVSVQLEDLLLLKLPVNIPGTSNEYKNWQRKMPGELLENPLNEAVRSMLESLRAERQ